jgi:hypothetical protein
VLLSARLAEGVDGPSPILFFSAMHAIKLGDLRELSDDGGRHDLLEAANYGLLVYAEQDFEACKWHGPSPIPYSVVSM